MPKSAIQLIASAIYAVWSSIACAQQPLAPTTELNTLLMHATFFIWGHKTNDPKSESLGGTAFVIAQPTTGQPFTGYIVLLTARHVLDDIGADKATLRVRRRTADGTYTPFDTEISIRANGKPLYVANNDADVAAMYVNLPDDVPVTGLTPDKFADDKRLERVDLHPGDEIFFLGFPYAASGPGGFPILRSGHIASYPLTPMKLVKDIYLDAFVEHGNSGGPAYFSFTNRFLHGEVFQSILGIVTRVYNPGITEFANKPLNLGSIVPGYFIRETLEKLGPKPHASKP